MRKVIPINEINDEMASYVGEKAYTLSILSKEGINVPQGFVLSFEAFNDILELNGIKSRIENIINQTDFNEEESIEQSSIAIKELINNATIPSEIRNNISLNYKKLAEHSEKLQNMLHMIKMTQEAYVALRISEKKDMKSFEDSPFSLNIKGEHELMSAIKSAYSSFFSSDALKIRKKENRLNDYSIALIIQKMVVSNQSGIIYSSNPANCSHDEIVIESVFGYGQQVISEFTPDITVIDKNTSRIKSNDISEKEYFLTRENGKTIKKMLTGQMRHMPSLKEAQVYELVKIAKDIEEIFSKPIQIEWGLTKNSISIFYVKDLKLINKSCDYKANEEYKTIVEEDFIGNMPTPVEDDPIISPDIEKLKPEPISDRCELEEIYQIIDKYITINPNLKEVFELLKKDIKEYRNHSKR